MGYTTEFYGSITIDPPLNAAEVDYLRRFAATRRMTRTTGPFVAQPTKDDPFGQERDETVIDGNNPPPGQPGLWCQWVPTEDGAALQWDEGEKFYCAPEWMAYLIDTFLRPRAKLQSLLEVRADLRGTWVPTSRPRIDDPAFLDFTFDHVLNGEIDAQGEDHLDAWQLVVEDNVVVVTSGSGLSTQVRTEGRWS